MTAQKWFPGRTGRISWETRRAGVIFVVVVVSFEIWNHSFISVSTAFTVLQGLTFLGLASLAMGLTMITGEFDLAIPSTAACAAIIAVDLSNEGVWVSVLAACAFGIIVGLLQGYLIWLLRINSLVFTIGTQIVLLGLATLISHTQTVVASNLSLALSIQHHYYVLSPVSIVGILAFLFVGLGLTYTQAGLDIRAAGGGRAEAIGSGIQLWRPIILVFLVSGIFSGLLGALSALSVGSASATMFSDLLLNAVAGALIGGISLRGGGERLRVLLSEFLPWKY